MKPIFENHPVLILIQVCYFQKQPEKILNLIDKKRLDIEYFQFFCLTTILLFYYTIATSSI